MAARADGAIICSIDETLALLHGADDAYCHEDPIMRWLTAIATLLSLALSGPSSAADTTNYSAAAAYIRCLATTYDLQRQAAADMAQSEDAASRLRTGIRIGAEANKEMRVMISSLNRLEVGDDAKVFVRHLSTFLKQKIALNKDLAAISSKMLGGRGSGAGHAELMTSGAQLSAAIQQINEQISKLAHAFFAVMIDTRPDEFGDVNHLKITRAQRDQLLKLISDRFGPSLDAKNENWTVRGAWNLHLDLGNDFKASDDHSPGGRGHKPRARRAVSA